MTVVTPRQGADNDPLATLEEVHTWSAVRLLDRETAAAELQRRVVATLRPSEAASTETLTPDPDRLVYALRQIGYSLEQALADLADNSINAGASTVLIRFVCRDERIVRVIIADDGAGMTAKELQNAMRFGSDPDLKRQSLGKFGMGLKLATLSHACTLTVGAWSKRRVSARRWSLEGIGRNWSSEILSPQAAGTLVRSPLHPVDLSDTGTVVIWDDIDKLPTSKGGLRYTLRSIHRRLQLHLGMCFHRFLENGRLQILVDQQQEGEAEHRIQAPITPLNPFAYASPGRAGFPKVFSVVLGRRHRLAIEGHIWPPNSESPEYRLGNRAAARQGFYFYRNDRLIQAGGWNGIVQSEAEPHGSLARVRIDLPPEMDDLFSLNVQKSSVVVSPGFTEAVLASEAKGGMTFEEYRHHAHEVYRKKDRKAARAIPLAPRRGIPRALQRAGRDLINPEGGSVRGVDILWADMPEDEFFRIDRDGYQILLNSYYRDKVLCGLKASGTDAPLIKLLIFFLCEADFDRKGSSNEHRQKLKKINALLIEAVQMGRG